MLVFALAILRAALVGASATEIPITLYRDNNCVDPSTTASNISLNINACVVTPGLGSFDLKPFPRSSGSVKNYVFTDRACGQLDYDYFSNGDLRGSNSCYGRIDGDVAAVMLSCNQETPGEPISTTTITVGVVATGVSRQQHRRHSPMEAEMAPPPPVQGRRALPTLIPTPKRLLAARAHSTLVQESGSSSPWPWARGTPMDISTLAWDHRDLPLPP
jgi:hypothetical protein